MSIHHYTVNDDIYGKILKTHSNLKPQKKTEYAEVYEAVEGLGIFLFLLKITLCCLNLSFVLFSNSFSSISYMDATIHRSNVQSLLSLM